MYKRQEQPNKNLKLDLFRPDPSPAGPVPCIICIHGGGYRVHRREWFAGHAAGFAKAGFVAVTIDYRKEPGIENRGDAIKDGKAAVRWVRANAEEYGIDPDRIGVIGGSAGGHMTSVLATTGEHPAMEGEGGNPGVSSAVQAAVPCAAGSNNLDRVKDDPEWLAGIEQHGREVVELICPYHQAGEGDPPLLLLHGSADGVVPPYHSEDLHGRYQELGLHSELEILEGARHTFYLSQETIDRATRFFREQFGMADAEG